MSINYELNWNKLIDFIGNDKEDEPRLRIPFSLVAAQFQKNMFAIIRQLF